MNRKEGKLVRNRGPKRVTSGRSFKCCCNPFQTTLYKLMKELSVNCMRASHCNYSCSTWSRAQCTFRCRITSGSLSFFKAYSGARTQPNYKITTLENLLDISTSRAKETAWEDIQMTTDCSGKAITTLTQSTRLTSLCILIGSFLEHTWKIKFSLFRLGNYNKMAHHADRSAQDAN